MPEDKENPTGTTEEEPTGTRDDDPDGGSGSDPAGGSGDDPAKETGEERLKAELAEERRKNEQLLSEKTRVERERREFEERRDERQRIESEQERLQSEQREMAARIAKLQVVSNSNEYTEQEREHAQSMLDLWKTRLHDHQSQQRHNRDVLNRIAMMEVPKEMRDRVKEYVNAGYDPGIAQKIVRGELAEEGKLPKTEPAPRANGERPPAVRTTTRSVTTKDLDDLKTIDELGGEIAALPTRAQRLAAFRDLADGKRKVKTA